MMEIKIYTANELRDVADFFDSNTDVIKQKVLSNAILTNIYESVLMLRQSADVVEENEFLKKQVNELQSRIDNAKKEVMDLRLELYKVCSDDFFQEGD